MDFLDPRKRRAHSIRLLIGYGLMAIVIILGAYLLVNAAYGYGFNIKTGDIIQNGLLFVDSQPGGASIYINDQTQGPKTSARLILPAGSYQLTLKKDGYRSWQRNFTLTEHSIARYVYPFLFPLKPQVKTLRVYPSNPPLISQSPDRRWLLVETPQSVSSGVVTFDEYDTTNLTQPPVSLSIPDGILTNITEAGSSLQEVEWSTDNKHLLLQHNYQDGSEFIIFNRDAPSQSVNINQLLNVTPTEVKLRDKKISQLYIYNQGSGDLQIADTTSLAVTPLLKHVLAFKSSGPNLISYVTNENQTAGQVAVRIWDGTKTYLLHNLASGSSYLIDMAQFQGHWYYIAGSDIDDRVNLYKDPLSTIQNPSSAKAIPLLSMHIKGATQESFSTNARFIEAEAGQDLAVYDMETQTVYHYTLSTPLSGALHWMDGHRLVGTSQNVVFVTDYDSTNQQMLVTTTYTQGGFFSRDYNHLFTFNPATDGNGVSLENIDMRAGVDLPKNQ